MNQSFTHPLFALTLLACASACSGSTTPAISTPSDASTGGGDDGGSPPTDGSAPGNDSASDAGSVSQACADWAHARCQRFNSCSDGLYVAIHWGDETTCEANSTALCATGLAAQGTGASAATFEACAIALPTESCSDFLGANPVAACAALVGSVATGSACLASSQCQTSYCAIPASSTCGTCAVVPKAGDACVAEADCGTRGGLTCAAGACVAFGAASASCSAKTAPCGIGLSCVGEKKATPGTCQPAASTVGATCDPKQTTGPGCDPTLELACDAATSMCVQNTVVTGAGTCGQVNGGLAKCSTSGTCVILATDAGNDDGGADGGAAPEPITGSCLAAAANASACDTSAGPACVPPAKCVTAGDGGTGGTCQVPNATTCQ